MATLTLSTPVEVIPVGDGSDPFGFILGPRGLKDWYSGSESKSDVNERAQGHGAFGIGTDWQSSLAISIDGSYVGESYGDAVAAAERLAAVNSGGRKVLVTVTDALRATSRLVSVRKVTIPDFGTDSEFEFTVDMIAADPLRYGDPISVSTAPPTSGGGMVWDAPAGGSALVGTLFYPGDDVFPSETLFPGGFE